MGAIIPWIPLISAGATLFGSLFGNQSNQNTAQTTNSSGSSVSNATEATTAGTTMTSGTSQNSTQNQTSNQTSAQTSQENQSGQISRLDTDTLAQLTAKVQQALSGSVASKAVNDQISQVSGSNANFDVDQYVAGIMQGAKSRVAGDLESGGNQLTGKIGASSSTNSAAALLKAKMNREATSELASTEAGARAQGVQLAQQLQESKTGQLTNLASQTDQQITGLLGQLLQARETQSANTTGQTGGTTSGSTNTTGTVLENTNQKQTQVQATTNDTSQRTSTTDITNQNVNKGSTNWGDFFTNIGKILGTSFENPATV